MTLVVGVDGGGTRTRAVVIDGDGCERGRAEGPGSVATADAPEAAAAAVAGAVRAAIAQAGGTLPVAALWAGLAGGGQAPARDAVAAELRRERLARRVQVGTDAEAAFHDAFGTGPGMLLIAGTGSIAWGRGPDGGTHRVGGWGKHVGDEGSGYWIGVSALRAVLRAEDGRGAPTALTGPVLAHCGATSADGLVTWIETASKAAVAGLVPVVTARAAAGDAASSTILDQAVAALDEHVGALLERMGTSGGPVPLLLWGGLLGDAGPLREAVVAAMASRPVTLVEGRVDPPAGAARLALALS